MWNLYLQFLSMMESKLKYKENKDKILEAFQETLSVCTVAAIDW